MTSQPPLLDSVDQPQAPRARPVRPRTIPWLRRHGRHALRDPRVRTALGSCAAAAALASGIVAFAAYKAPARPSAHDRLDTLFHYTLLTDQFNRLSVRERAEMIGQLARRVSDMEGSDSVLLAAFASTIRGEAREQLVENASRLFVDMIDEQAVRYDPNLPKEERVRQLEDSILEIARLFETMGAEDEPADAQEILDDAREQARRDAERVKQGEVSARDAARVMSVLNRTVGDAATPHQTARGGRMLRDMTRHLRGQDIDTGKPVRIP